MEQNFNLMEETRELTTLEVDGLFSSVLASGMKQDRRTTTARQ